MEDKFTEYEQVQNIMNLTPVYANRFVFFIEDNMVRLTFIDENGKHNIKTYKTSIIMTINGFMALVGMIAPQAEQIKTKFEAMQTAKSPSQEVH